MKEINSILGSLRRRVAVETQDGSSVMLPVTEFMVFALLCELVKRHATVHGPAIAKASNGELSVATVYGSLNRLAAKGVVTSREDFFDIGSSTVRRVSWIPTARTVSLGAPQKDVRNDADTMAQPA